MTELEKPKKRIINPEIIKKYWQEHQRCELCGDKKTDSSHHIKFKSQGGDDLPANLITLCNNFSKKKQHMCAHYQFMPYLSEETLYEIKGVCKSYPNIKADNCPVIFDGKNFETCKWYGWCKFTYDEEYQKRFEELKKKMEEDERKGKEKKGDMF